MCVGSTTVDVPLTARIPQAPTSIPSVVQSVAEALGPPSKPSPAATDDSSTVMSLRVVGQLDSQRLGQSDWAVRIRCLRAPRPPVATKLAQHPDTAWVRLTSGPPW